MKIRTRITLWITLTGLLSSLILALIVFFELLEQPYELVDQELDSHVQTLADNVFVQTPRKQVDQTDPYWIRITDTRDTIVYESDLVRFADLPLRDGETHYSVNTAILMSDINSQWEDDEQVMFRVGVYRIPAAGHDYLVQIARPIENLHQEVVDLIIIIAFGLVVSAIVLVLVGYYVSGHILKPIRKINKISNEINEKTLAKRIPLGTSGDELHDLSSSLNLMFDRLQFSFTQQKEFIANASHELQTPLTTLRLSLEQLSQKTDLPPDMQKEVAKQGETLLRMTRLVKNLLDLSVLELGDSLKTEEFSFNALMNSIVEEFMPLIKEKKIDFFTHLDKQLQVVADRDKIRRVLINLLDNAIKYNYNKGQIKINGRREKNVLVFEIFNTGPGIPINEQELIFEQFYRVERSRSLTHGGSGLGLTIVKRIIELHGGRISAQSKPDEWTQIQFSLPMHK